MRCGWKVPLRRAQIRHAIGRLCPGSVMLTQLPWGCGGEQRVCSVDNKQSDVARPPISHLALRIYGIPQQEVCFCDQKHA